MTERPLHFATLGMFIIDEFSFMNEDGSPTGKTLAPQIGGGGTYAAIGARIWLPANHVGMVVDRGYDFPSAIETKLLSYGRDMWMFRDQPHCQTTRALNSYKGEYRDFKYITSRIRITPRDLTGTKLAKPPALHFICSPTRAASIMSEVHEVESWKPPITIYEPIPDRCVPEELSALKHVMSLVSVLSPNAEEALSLLSMPLPPTRSSIEKAARKFLEFGVGEACTGSVIIRSGGMGAYVKTRGKEGRWVDAYWTNADSEKIVDVTGAGNAFLGGLAAGLLLTNGDIYKAALYGAVSASLVIEQVGLPTLQSQTINPFCWNGEVPQNRLDLLRERHKDWSN